MTNLTARTERGVVGTVTLHNGKVTSSTPGVQEIVDARFRRYRTPQAAFWSLYKWSNGYLTFEPDLADDGQMCVSAPATR
jgi:hypothetical protein